MCHLYFYKSTVGAVQFEKTGGRRVEKYARTSCVGEYLDENNPIVYLKQGAVRGVSRETPSNYPYDVFYAIPFAKPPVGNLRFKEPENADGWQGIRDATIPGPFCSQTTSDEYIGGENCLYVNVYKPKNLNKNIPVMIWVHGGAFIEGGANEEDPKLLVEKGVIVVSTNYRLGIFGFLCLNNTEVAGNAAIKDIILALRWVKNNIKHFGGDENNVTVLGQSAGAALVHSATISSLSKNLLNRAIIQSGSIISERRIQENPGRVARQLAELLNVASDKNQELLDVLRKLPPEEILRLASKIPKDGRQSGFRPVVDGDYSINPIFSVHPREIMNNENFQHIPTICGHNSQEGVLFLPSIDYQNADNIDEIIPDFGYFIPDVLRNILLPHEKKEVEDKIRKFYFGSNNKSLLDNFIDIMSDYDYIKDVDRAARLFSRSSDTFYYHFSYNGAYNMDKYSLENYTYLGASHSDELGYLFDMTTRFPEINFRPTKLDIAVQNIMIDMWTNFVKFGNPTPENINITWEPIIETKTNCLIIDKDLKLLDNLLHERIRFWEDLESNY